MRRVILRKRRQLHCAISRASISDIPAIPIFAAPRVAASFYMYIHITGRSRPCFGNANMARIMLPLLKTVTIEKTCRFPCAVPVRRDVLSVLSLRVRTRASLELELVAGTGSLLRKSAHGVRYQPLHEHGFC